jgi:quinol monooxygenase YgiN
MLFAKYGCLGTQIVQANGDPLDIVIINTWPDKKSWDDFGAAHALPEYKGKLMTPEDGGVIGGPSFFGGEVL